MLVVVVLVTGVPVAVVHEVDVVAVLDGLVLAAVLLVVVVGDVVLGDAVLLASAAGVVFGSDMVPPS